ncbi:MAG: hypothetical protein LAP38_26295 [Acidobacteriia bacterium]|nr:hypothetical protein [Terriglobia bacterium]
MKKILEQGRNDPDYAKVKSILDMYIKGVGDGLVWANAELLGGHRQQLYCSPKDLGLNADNYHQLLESFLPTLTQMVHWPYGTLKWKSVEDMPVGAVLLTALIHTFPCPQEKEAPK